MKGRYTLQDRSVNTMFNLAQSLIQHNIGVPYEDLLVLKEAFDEADSDLQAHLLDTYKEVGYLIQISIYTEGW
jgi:hypothetical protein